MTCGRWPDDPVKIRGRRTDGGHRIWTQGGSVRHNDPTPIATAHHAVVLVLCETIAALADIERRFITHDRFQYHREGAR